MIDRRKPDLDDARMSTQRFVTYVLLLIFSAVTAAVFIGNDQSERSTMIQTIINLTLIAVGYWLGSSKDAIDKNASISRIAEAAVPVAGIAPIKADEVKIDTKITTVTEAQPTKGTEIP